MNKEEIDKILSRLERIDHKEYSCSFEFADSSSFEEVCMCFDERKKIANYIKELQQENKDLKEEIKKLQRIVISKQEDYLIISVGEITKVFKLNDNKKWINEVGDNNE